MQATLNRLKLNHAATLPTTKARIPDILLASKSALEKLSEEDVALIKECALMTEEFQIKKWAEKEEASLKIINQTATVIDLPQEELIRLKEMTKSVYEKYEAQYGYLIKEILATE